MQFASAASRAYYSIRCKGRNEKEKEASKIIVLEVKVSLLSVFFSLPSDMIGGMMT